MRTLKMALFFAAFVTIFGLVLAGTGVGQNQNKQFAYQDKINKFLEETVTMRQDLAAKQSEIQKEMLSVDPDREKITVLSKEVTQLRDTLETKAREDGIDLGQRGGCGCGGPGPRGYKS